MELEAGTDDAGRRLDRILRKALPDHPLSLIHRLLRQGRVRVNGTAARPGDRVEAGDVISLPLDEAVAARRVATLKSPAQRAADLPDILWQGSGLLALNKPAGLTVHGHDSLDTLVQAHLAGTLPHSLSFRPGPLHRLDKPSSGIIVFSTTLAGARRFSALMREQRLTKTYLALVEGTVESGETWQDDLFRNTDTRTTLSAGPDTMKAKPALTTIQPLASNGSCSLIRAQIHTGRTHQIRAQAASHGHPLAGDLKYGGGGTYPAERSGLLLHAWKLECTDTAPVAQGFPPLICAPLPAAFQARIHELFDIDIALCRNPALS